MTYGELKETETYDIEAMTISTLASSLKTKHGINIQYDAIIQAANRLFDLADHIEKL